MSDNRPRLTVATVVERDGAFLMVEERVAGHDTPVFNQPAGHVEADESLAQAACRETLEETGWRIQPLSVLGFSLYRPPTGGPAFFRAAFVATALEQVHESPPDAAVIAAHWLTYDQIVDKSDTMRSPLVLATIDRYRSGHRYPLDIIHFQQP